MAIARSGHGRPFDAASHVPAIDAADVGTLAVSRAPLVPSAPPLEGQIVFEDSGQDFQPSQIWLENADGSNVRQVVSDDFIDNSASLSPDGKSDRLRS